jgi:hypothetical protein
MQSFFPISWLASFQPMASVHLNLDLRIYLIVNAAISFRLSLQIHSQLPYSPLIDVVPPRRQCVFPRIAGHPYGEPSRQTG